MLAGDDKLHFLTFHEKQKSFWHHDSQNNDSQHNDSQQNVTHQNSTQHYNSILRHCAKQHSMLSVCYVNCHSFHCYSELPYAGCHYAECRGAIFSSTSGPFDLKKKTFYPRLMF
jgi:hypothetical protein